MKSRLLISIGLVVVAGAVTAGFLFRGHSGYTASYRFVAVDRGDIESTVSSTGTLGAVTTVQVERGPRVESLLYGGHVRVLSCR